MKIVFFGSDEFSLAALKVCLDSPHAIALIVTTPPQKQGRGLNLNSMPVQREAERQGLVFIAPENLKDPSALDRVREIHPDLFVVSSYGKYIPSLYLEMPRIASLNVHPSLLPRYRGSTPVQSAILNGDKETGVSIIEVAKKLDAGDIFMQERLTIEPEDDYPALLKKLADLSGRMLARILEELTEKRLKRTAQDETLATLTRKITKEDALLSFSEPAEILARKVRAFRPWPGTYIPFEETRLAILDLIPLGELSEEGPGTLLRVPPDGTLLIATGRGTAKIGRVQMAGKKPVSGKDFVNGRRIKAGFRFST